MPPRQRKSVSRSEPAKPPENQLLLPGAVPASLSAIWPFLAGKFSFEGESGRGKTGIAFKIADLQTKRPFCLKTARPDLVDVVELQRFADSLKKEVAILEPLFHSGLPAIFSHNLSLERPFYICTFHGGKTLSKFVQHKGKLPVQESTYVISLLIDVIAYLHSRGRTHCDLHSKNILISEAVLQEGILVIDFGSGHRESDSDPLTENRGNIYLKPASAAAYGSEVRRGEENSAFRASDFIALGRLLSEAASSLFADGSAAQRGAFAEYHYRLRSGAIADWDNARDGLQRVVEPYKAITLINRLFQEDSGEQKWIPLPVSHRVPVGPAPLDLINCIPFQRLRWIKQLSFCDWYFPGASHSRFEHSIGVFNLVRIALNNLSRDKAFRERYSYDDLKACLVAALFHDVGHYPFAHVLEQYAASRFGDEAETKAFVSHANHSRTLMRSPEILAAMKSWGGEGIVQRAISVLDGKLGVLSDLIDGPIDCDKLDYLTRDSLHCGLPIAVGLDLDGFLSSERCISNCSKLGIDHHGVAAIEGFMVLQDQMLSSVYWHETMRGIICMFHVAIAHIVKNDKLAFRDLVRQMMNSHSEKEAVTNVLLPQIAKLKKVKAEGVKQLIGLHVRPQFLDIYRPIATYRHSDEPVDGRVQTVYQKLVAWNPSGLASSIPVNWKSVKALREAYSQAFKGRGWPAEEHEILIDAPIGKNANRMVSVLRRDGTPCDITSVSHLNKTIFDHPALYASPIRVFVSPRLAEASLDKIEIIILDAEKAFSNT